LFAWRSSFDQARKRRLSRPEPVPPISIRIPPKTIDKQRLLELAERVEASGGADHGGMQLVRKFTALPDAAMTLIPDGYASLFQRRPTGRDNC
jgi:hypothetical protein